MINLFQEAFDFQAVLLGQAQKSELEKKELEAQLVELVKENSELRKQVAMVEELNKNRPVPGQKIGE